MILLTIQLITIQLVPNIVEKNKLYLNIKNRNCIHVFERLEGKIEVFKSHYSFYIIDSIFFFSKKKHTHYIFKIYVNGY